MFGELAFADVIALALASILLAGAAAAAFVAYLTARSRPAATEGTAGRPPAGRPLRSTVSAVVRDQGGKAAKSFQDTPDDWMQWEAQHSAGHVASSSGEAEIDEAGRVQVVERPNDHTPQHAIPVPDIAAPQFAMATVAPSSPDADFAALGASRNRATPDPKMTNGRETDEAARLAERAARLRGRPLGSTNAPVRDQPSGGSGSGWEPQPVAPTPERTSSPSGFANREPGFFEDPLGRHDLRYWDGARWTEHVKEQGARFTDPL